jgi:hypothetical protein
MQSNFATTRHIRKSQRPEFGNHFVTNNSVRVGSKGDMDLEENMGISTKL